MIAEDLLDRNFGVTLGFIGAGGQDKIFGILNLLPFGVEQPVCKTSSTPLLCSSLSTAILFLDDESLELLILPM